jgi:hypothetical protein
MTAAEFAVLLQFQPVLHGSLVLCFGIVSLLTTGACQGYDAAHKDLLSDGAHDQD